MYGCEGIAAQRVCEVSQTKEMTVYEEIIMIDVPEYPRNERTRTNEMSKYTMKWFGWRIVIKAWRMGKRVIT